MYKKLSKLPAKCVSVIVFSMIMLIAQAAFTQEESENQSLEEWQQRELRPLVEAVGAVLTGNLVQTSSPFEFKPDFLKGVEGSSYVPFTLTVDPTKVNESTVLMYLFVTPHTAAADVTEQADADAAEQADEEEGDRNIREAFENVTFEDAFFVDVSKSRAEGGMVEIHRAFTAPGGSYDVYVALRDSKGADADDDALAESLVMMVKEQVEVPDLWSGALQTSSVIVTGLVENLSQPLTPEEQIANPYTLGETRIVPKQGDIFRKDEDISLLMLIYNPNLDDNQKPDLTVDYEFHKLTDTGSEFFNRTNPQHFNAQTLPPGFDVEVGHQIVAGQSVPLASFSGGNYRLNIKVIDNTSGQSVLRGVSFTVNE